MDVVALHADARANVRRLARSDLLERRLAQYRPRFEPRVRALALRHPRLKDLAASFPALLFALAVPRAGFDPAPVVARVIDGAPLRELAGEAGVPLWLRRFAPEAFAAPIPPLPDGASMRRQIVNHCPRRAKLAPLWLWAVSSAWVWCDEALAVWMAREVLREPKLKAGELPLVSLWAWHARHQSDFDGGPNDVRWAEALPFSAAVHAAHVWWQRLQLQRLLGHDCVRDMWVEPGQVGDYDFVPLRTAEEIMEEARAMANCVHSYGWRISRNSCRLWSMRQNGARVATIEIAFRRTEPVPDVVQLRTAHNGEAPAALWLAARQWLYAQDLSLIERPKLSAGRASPEREIWRKQWKPYWLAKGRIPSWLPLRPVGGALDLAIPDLPR